MTYEKIWLLLHTGAIEGLSFDPEGTHIATIAESGVLLITKVDSNEYLTHMQLTLTGKKCKHSYDGLENNLLYVFKKNKTDGIDANGVLWLGIMSLLVSIMGSNLIYSM